MSMVELLKPSSEYGATLLYKVCFGPSCDEEDLDRLLNISWQYVEHCGDVRSHNAIRIPNRCWKHSQNTIRHIEEMQPKFNCHNH